MPAFDGTGPWGAGLMTGWGAGWCATGRRPSGYGYGCGGYGHAARVGRAPGALSTAATSRTPTRRPPNVPIC